MSVKCCSSGETVLICRKVIPFLNSCEVDHADIFVDRVAFYGNADDAELRVQDDASMASVADTVIDEQADDDFAGRVQAIGDIFPSDSPFAVVPEAGAGD